MDSIWPALDRISFELDPDLGIVSPTIALGLQCWLDAKGNAELPSRRDIDPTRLPANMLPHTLLIDVEEEPVQRFRWRLIGTRITQVVGRDSTGKWWDELYSDDVFEALATGPRWAISHRRPIRTLGQAPLPDRAFLRSENIDMPLSSDGERIDMLMTISVYE